jgi:hypothetical protein
MERKVVIGVLTLVAGIFVGSAASHGINAGEVESRNYCQSVEEGIQENMSEGFINCYPPGVLRTNLSDDVEEGSETECVCRKKIGDLVQVLKFASSN